MKKYIDNLLNNPEVQRDTDRLYIMRLAEVYQDLQEQGITLTPEKLISVADGHYNELREACKYVVTALYLEGITLDEAFNEPKNYSCAESGTSPTRTNEEIINFYLTGNYKVGPASEPNKDEDSINQSKRDKIYEMLERYIFSKNPFNLPLKNVNPEKVEYKKPMFNLEEILKDIPNLSSQYHK
ncbi:MAG TPA: hypothetical protein VJB35_00165 [Candidatus Nanoarchaeia archaeon]|nr:hypothetical protein [Candidatus Nanoarchaeia archaeon]